jgi:hypothetical protein
LSEQELSRRGQGHKALTTRTATSFAYLAGRRQAILEIATDRSALGVGTLLVLSAGLARNYDRASLLHEPWRLLGPFVASLAVSGPLFLSVYGLARWKAMESPGIGRAYCSFLGLVQTQVTLGGVKPMAPWPETLAPRSLVAGTARPYIKKSVTLAPIDLNQARSWRCTG